MYAKGLDFLPECEHRFFLALQSGKAISKSLARWSSQIHILSCYCMSTQIGSKLKTKLQEPSTVNSCSRCYYHLWHLFHLPFPPSEIPGRSPPVPDIHISQGLHSNLDRAGVRKGDDSHPGSKENCFFTRNSKLFRFPQKHSTCTGFFFATIFSFQIISLFKFCQISILKM